MKTLILIRHGKSDWDGHSGDDHGRPLAPRGQRASHRMGRFLAGAGFRPDRVISSTAERARATAEIVIDSAQWGVALEQTRDFYATTPVNALQTLRSLPTGPAPTDDDCRLIVGHEPTWSGLASHLVGGGNLEVKTATCVCIELAIHSWSQLAPGRGILRLLLPPRTLQALIEAPKQK